MENVVILRVEMAVGSITESSQGGPDIMAQNPDQRDFSGNRENTPLMSASSRVDFNIDQNRNDATRNFKAFEDFRALKPMTGKRTLITLKISS